MDLSAINELDFNEAGEWPLAAKGTAIALIFSAALYGLFSFQMKPHFEAMDKLKVEEVELKQSLELKQARAVNLPAYKEQLNQVRSIYDEMLGQLPDSAEVANLLVDISMAGLKSGLNFELFEPQSEQPQDFYADLPIHMRVSGSYHQMGLFSESISKLPRIVTLDDMHIYPKRISKKNGVSGQYLADDKTLIMDVTAKTYRYLTDEEVYAAEMAEEGGGK